MALGEFTEDVARAIRPPADNPTRVRLDPHDRPVRFGDDAVRIDRLELLENVARAVLLDDADVTAVRPVDRIPVAGIGEVQAAVRSECQIVRRRQGDAVGLRDDDLHSPVRGDPLNRWWPSLGRNPGANRRTLSDVEGPVGTEHARVRATARARERADTLAGLPYAH